MKPIKDCGYYSFMKLYNIGILPILNYGAGVWGYYYQEKHECIQRRALRYFLGVHRFSPNHAIEGDIGVVSTSVARHIEILRLWNRLVTMQDNRLTRKLFNYDFSICKDNWSEEVGKILNVLGMDNYFISQSPVDIVTLKGMLLSIEFAKWEETRFSKPKLRY